MPSYRIVGIGPTNRQEELIVNIPDATVTGVVGPSSTEVADTTPISTAKMVKYQIAVWTANKTRTMTMIVTYDSTGVRDSVYGKTGSSISISLSAIINGTNVELVIGNGELLPLTYQVQKVLLP